jgi:hypothetical protein
VYTPAQLGLGIVIGIVLGALAMWIAVALDD